MAKEKVKKVSINTLEKTLQNNTIEVAMNGNEEATITITKTLPLVDMMVFVSEVVDSVIDEDTGAYRPEMLEYMTRYCVMTMYANLTLPKDPEKAYALMYNTHAYDQIEEEINAVQFSDIKDTIARSISHKLAMIRSSVVQQANEYVEMMRKFTESVEPMFNGIDGEEIANFFKRMSEEERLDERKIATVIHELNNPQPKTEAEVIEFSK